MENKLTEKQWDTLSTAVGYHGRKVKPNLMPRHGGYGQGPQETHYEGCRIVERGTVCPWSPAISQH